MALLLALRLLPLAAQAEQQQPQYVLTTSQNQVAHSTGENRYPYIFARARSLSRALFPRRHPKILSFGSSTGQEALTLATRYFHHSTIVGVDVDEPTLAQARSTISRANISDRVFFFNSQQLPLDSLGTYDIIFADSVLCHHPWNTLSTPAEWYPFSLFEKTLAQLHQVLHEGGILVAINTNYRFEDTSVAHAYRAAPMQRVNCTPQIDMPLFAPSGTRISRQQEVCVFIKQ